MQCLTFTIANPLLLRGPEAWRQALLTLRDLRRDLPRDLPGYCTLLLHLHRASDNR